MSDLNLELEGTVTEHWEAVGTFHRMFDPSRILVVKLRGADRVMLRALLGDAGATPHVNTTAPVKGPARCLYWRTVS